MKSVGREIASGTIYNALAKYAGVIINLVVSAVLARILTPDDFGVVALTTVFITFFDLLGNMGFGPAIIQNKNLDNKDLASIFNFTIIIAIAFATVCFLISYKISIYYDNHALINIMKILSLQVFFSIINVVPYSLILKDKRFKFVSISTVSCNTFYGFVAVLAAIGGLGIYSLLITPVFSVFTLFIIYLIKSQKIYGSFLFPLLSLKSIKKVLSFSIYQFLFNIVNYFSRNLDKLLLGKHFSMSDLGYYEKSYRVMQLPISNISSVLSPTIQPVLSNYQNDTQRLSYYISSIIKLLAFIGAAITPFCFFASSEIILIIFGDQWYPSIPIFQILSLSIFAQVIDSASGGILQSANAPKVLFLSGIICALLNVLAIVIGVYYFHSLTWIAILLDISFVANLIIDIGFIYNVALNSSFSIIFDIFKHPVIIAVIEFVTLSILSIFDIGSIWLSFSIKLLIVIVEVILYSYASGLMSLLKERLHI